MHVEPCPFCGAREANANAYCMRFETLEPAAVDGALRVNMDGFGWYWVMCSNCQAQGPRYHGEGYGRGNTGPKNMERDHEKTARAIDAAVDAWNNRPMPTL